MKYPMPFYLLLLVLLMSSSCKESTEPEPWSGEAQLSQVPGCQDVYLWKSALVDSFTYQLDDELILTFFVESNCCPDSDRFELFSNVDEDTIAITVVDTAQHLCDCICPYRILAEFTDLPRDEYTVKVTYYGEVMYLEAVQREFFNAGSQADVDLAIHLLATDTLNAYDVLEQSLGSLELDKNPILTVEDITRYEWSDHSLIVTAGADERMESILGEYGTHIGVHGAPFVLIVEGERIYLGAFWTPVSSIPPPCPSITFPPLAEGSRTLFIVEPWGDTYPDLRGDQRIHEALEAAGVLREDYATLESLEVRFLNVSIWLDRMPVVGPLDTNRFNCWIDLELHNTSTDKVLEGLSIPDCTVELDSTGEFVGDISLTSDWDGNLAAGAIDTVRLTRDDTLPSLSMQPCDADVTVKLQVYDRWETSQAYQSGPVEFVCTY